jgi:iron complex outermembrane receptor protein
LSLIATYAFTDARIIKNNDGNEGNRLINVPEHSGSVWLKYEFKEAALKGLSLGTGVYVLSEREGNTANTFDLPGYVRWDAMAAYRWQFGPSRLTAQVNINNILDKEYFASGSGFLDTAFPAEPLTVLGSIRVEF